MNTCCVHQKATGVAFLFVFRYNNYGDYMSIEVAIDDFINYCVFEKGLSDKTCESYKYDLKVYKEYLEKNHITSVDKIKTKTIEDYLKYSSIFNKNDNKESKL